MRCSLNVRGKIRLGVVFVVAPLMVSCNSGSKSQPEGAQHSVEVIGAGSSFVYPVMTRWISSFAASHPAVVINYQSIGRGGGIEQLKQGILDFGASDAALDDQKLTEMPALLQIPESAGPVCITYNLPELKMPLKLSAETLSGIYLGKITKWNDPSIKKDNAGVVLPNHEIVVAHRSDGSGTTNSFTTYLAKVSPAWEKQVGKGIDVNWPIGLGGKGNEGVTGLIKQTPGGIGYVELIYATQNALPLALLRNNAGNWTEPTVASTTAAIAAFSDELTKDVRTPIVDPPATAKNAYPIAGLTFLLVPKKGKTPAKGQAVKDFVKYIVMHGQDEAETLYYAKLPAELQQQDEKLLAEVGTQSN